MASPADDVNRAVRTVIEAADPALRPVHKLRRFVVKRVELVLPWARDSEARTGIRASERGGTQGGSRAASRR